MPAALRTLGFALALALLNAALVLGDFLETGWALLPAELSLELVALAALFGWLAWRGRRPSSRLLWTLSALLLAALLVRFGAIVVPWYFGRDLNLAVDLAFLPFGLGLLHASVSGWIFAGVLGGAAIAVALALVAARLLVGLAARAVAGRRWGAAGLALASVAVGAALAPPRYDLAGPPVAAHVAGALARNVALGLDAAGVTGTYLALIDQAIAARPRTERFAALAGRNVLLVFVESYGAITLTDPELRAGLAATRARWAERLPAAGYHVVSDVLNSPITGGGSWMAHATLNFGIRVDNQPLYDVLLASHARPLGADLRRDGWRTVAAQPRMQQPWLQAGFFGFDAVLDDPAFDYRGPRFSWETTPDQFVLERVHARELAAKDGKPRFLMVVLSSSHAPFDVVPPLIADGRTIGDGAIYAGLPVERFPPPRGIVFENRAGYLATVRYSLEALENYLTQRLDDDSLVIVLGDHQPPLSIAAATRNKAVPIHVLSRDPALLEPFRRMGFAEGVVPARTETDAGMEGFLARFLAAFGAPPS